MVRAWAESSRYIVTRITRITDRETIQYLTHNVSRMHPRTNVFLSGI